ncbi:MAG: hypothetical protein JXX14_07435 [Deltaproteobacteria bacterium]|nr:hypothetical protein [Deltaproteobacteria bacterium]
MAKVKVKARHRKKYVILPVSLLVFNLLHEFIVYKADIIGNRYLQTLFLMAMFMTGFAFVTFIVAPAVERTVEKMVLSGKKGAGFLGEIIIAILFFAGLFYLYMKIYTSPDQIESVLPEMLMNSSTSLLSNFP